MSLDLTITNSTYFASDMAYAYVFYGGLAQLARALAWHARGHRFESDILHVFLATQHYRFIFPCRQVKELRSKNT